MSKLRQTPARPRSSRRVPSYPRCLGVGVIAIVAACGGNVEDGSDNPGGEGGSTSTGSPTTTMPNGGAAGVGGQGAAAGQGGQGGDAGHGTGAYGGGLDGFAPPPFGGGGAGGFGDSAS